MKNEYFTKGLFLLSVSVFFVSVANAQQRIHKWVDENGVVHYGERAPSGVNSQKITIQKSPQKPANRVSRSARRNERRQAVPKADVQVSHDSSEAICTRARVEFEILIEQRPVYRTQNGELRVPWAADTYKGPRYYLDDETRQRQIDQAVTDVVNHCEDPLDQDLHQAAWENSRNSDLCEFAKQDYQDALRPSSRATEEYIAERRRRIQEHCGE